MNSGASLIRFKKQSRSKGDSWGKAGRGGLVQQFQGLAAVAGKRVDAGSVISRMMTRCVPTAHRFARVSSSDYPATVSLSHGSQSHVCQHYHDFLNRQPDASGWDFWTNQLTSCGTNQ